MSLWPVHQRKLEILSAQSYIARVLKVIDAFFSEQFYNFMLFGGVFLFFFQQFVVDRFHWNLKRFVSGYICIFQSGAWGICICRKEHQTQTNLKVRRMWGLPYHRRSRKLIFFGSRRYWMDNWIQSYGLGNIRKILSNLLYQVNMWSHLMEMDNLDRLLKLKKNV